MKQDGARFRLVPAVLRRAAATRDRVTGSTTSSPMSRSSRMACRLKGRAELDGVTRGLLDLAELRMDTGNDYGEQNPRRLGSVSTDRLIVWYQKFEDRKRPYVVRVTWFG